MELASYFCEDDKTFQLDDCVRLFSTFFDSFLRASQVRVCVVLVYAYKPSRPVTHPETGRSGDDPYSLEPLTSPLSLVPFLPSLFCREVVPLLWGLGQRCKLPLRAREPGCNNLPRRPI